jgi:hypothetical protein
MEVKSEGVTKPMFDKKSSYKQTLSHIIKQFASKDQAAENKPGTDSSQSSNDSDKSKKGSKEALAANSNFKTQEGEKSDNSRNGSIGREREVSQRKFSGRGNHVGRVGRGSGNDGQGWIGKEYCDGCGNTHVKKECTALFNECVCYDMTGHIEIIQSDGRRRISN